MNEEISELLMKVLIFKITQINIVNINGFYISEFVFK